MKLIIAALLALSLPVLADTPPPEAPPPDVVVLPRGAVQDVLSVLQSIAILHPDLGTQSVNAAYTRLTVCLQANNGGASGQCPEVAEVIRKAGEAKAVAADKAKPKDKPKH